MPDPCEWHETDYAWETGCGEAFVFIEGGPAENKMRYCPYCGRAIAVIVVVPPADEDEEGERG